jgi:hypothetical protein
MMHPVKSHFLVQRWSNFALLLFCSLELKACIAYQHAPGVKTLDSTVVTTYLVDNEHGFTNVWAIKNIDLKKDHNTPNANKTTQ